MITSHHQMKISSRLIVISIILLGITVYFNVLPGSFLWDDNQFIRYNNNIKSFSNFTDIVTHNVAHGGPGTYVYYRPLQELTYVLDYQFFKFDVREFHLTSIFIHILTALCVYLFLKILTNNILLSGLTAILFTIHPIQTEAVSYIAGRGEPLSTLFIILTLIFYLKNLKQEDKLFSFAVGLSYFLALLSKENAIILLPIVFIYHYCYKEKISFHKLKPLLASLLIYILGKIFFVHSSTNILDNLHGFQDRIPGFFYALIMYFKLLLWPFDLHFDYGQMLFSWDNPIVLIGIALFVALILLGIRLRHQKPLISFAIFWFLIWLLPYSNMIRLFNFMAEHFLYLPSIGFFLVLSMGLTKLFYSAEYPAACCGDEGGSRTLRSSQTKRSEVLERSRVGYSASKNELFHLLRRGSFSKINTPLIEKASLGLIVLFLGSLTILQNTYWLNPIVFYKRILHYNPLSYSSYLNLGVEYSRRAETEKEVEMYKMALSLNPDDYHIYKNLGLALIELNDLASAKQYLEKGKKINDKIPQIYNGLGVIANREGNDQIAIDYFNKAIGLKPKYTDAYFNLGKVYFDQNNTQMVLEISKVLEQINDEKYKMYCKKYLKPHETN